MKEENSIKKIMEEKTSIKKIMEDEMISKGGKPVQRGGKRPNAGRPRGSKNKLTKKAKIHEKTVKERILKNTDKLLNAQISLAQGEQFLYEIKMRNVGGRRKAVHTLVTDPKKIQEYLDDELDENSYCYITTKSPDNKAIDSLLDRGLGKATTNAKTETAFTFELLDYKQPEMIDGNVQDVLPDNKTENGTNKDNDTL